MSGDYECAEWYALPGSIGTCFVCWADSVSMGWYYKKSASEAISDAEVYEVYMKL